MLLLFLALMGILILSYAVIHPSMVQEDITQTDLFTLIKANKVDSIVNEIDPSSNQHFLTGTYLHQVVPNGKEVKGAFKVPVDLSLNPDLAKDIKAGRLQ